MTDPLYESVSVYLAIESDSLAPEQITELVGVEPDRTWRIGQSRGHAGKVWGINGWILEEIVRIGDGDGVAVEAAIPVALERFERRLRAAAIRIRSLDDAARRFTVVSVAMKPLPGIELSHEFLEMVATYGGTLQIDC